MTLSKIIKTHCVTKGDFTLSSGEKSDIYVDLKFGTLYGPCLFEIVRELRSAIGNLDFDAIGGPSIGVDAIVGAYLFMHIDKGFLIRKDSKKHGKSGRVVGSVVPGDRCVVIEDVTTTGNSLLDAICEIEKFGCKVIKTFSIVDRLQGATELMKLKGIAFESILNIEDLK